MHNSHCVGALQTYQVESKFRLVFLAQKQVLEQNKKA